MSILKTESLSESLVVVVPFSKAMNYYLNEIVCEGAYSHDVAQLILLSNEPNKKAIADQEWIVKVFGDMQYARDSGENAAILVNEQLYDVGLIDVQIFFKQDCMLWLTETLKNDPDVFITENLRHLDELMRDKIHDQMVITSCVHKFDACGKFLFHNHNIIFSLRREGCRRACIDPMPILSAIGRSGSNIYFGE